MALGGNTTIMVRGATILFATTFLDPNGTVVQPNAAFVNVKPQSGTAAQVPMAPPHGAETRWTAFWDSRGVDAPQTIFWSIHSGTGDPVPVVAEDGQFTLSANPANLVTF